MALHDLFVGIRSDPGCLPVLILERQIKEFTTDAEVQQRYPLVGQGLPILDELVGHDTELLPADDVQPAIGLLETGSTLEAVATGHPNSRLDSIFAWGFPEPST